jgi:hypothetical protein
MFRIFEYLTYGVTHILFLKSLPGCHYIFFIFEKVCQVVITYFYLKSLPGWGQSKRVLKCSQLLKLTALFSMSGYKSGYKNLSSDQSTPQQWHKVDNKDYSHKKTHPPLPLLRWLTAYYYYSYPKYCFEYLI